jgi:hypothetical protein
MISFVIARTASNGEAGGRSACYHPQSRIVSVYLVCHLAFTTYTVEFATTSFPDVYPARSGALQSLTARFQLQDYDANLLVVHVPSNEIILTVSAMTGTSSETVSQPVRGRTGQEADEERRHYQPVTDDKISRLIDWLHHAYDPTISSIQSMQQLVATPTHDMAAKMKDMWISLHTM